MRANLLDDKLLKNILRCLPVTVIAVTVLVAQTGGVNPEPVNLDFAQGEIGKAPTGWTGLAEITGRDAKTGKRSAKVSGTKDSEGRLIQFVAWEPFHNQKIGFRAAIKTAAGCQARLHITALGFSRRTVDTPPIAASDWQYVDVSVEVRPLNDMISFGFTVQAGCDAWIGDANLSVIEELPKPPTRLVMLGTGNPAIDPERSGPAVAVIANEKAYLVDAGPGVVRRAQEAVDKTKIGGLQPGRLNRLFITHLHSDHTVGYPDLIFTPAVVTRRGALEVYGPPGLREMTDHLLAAWRKDMDVRLNGVERGNRDAYRVVVHEIAPGVVYRDDNVTVEAIPVKHAEWDHAFGYKFIAADRTIVISGDTTPSESIVKACSGCDVLVHEVYCDVTSDSGPMRLRESHTSAVELARIAAEAKPKLLVLYDQSVLRCASEATLVQQVQKGYSGRVASSNDFDVF